MIRNWPGKKCRKNSSIEPQYTLKNWLSKHTAADDEDIMTSYAPPTLYFIGIFKLFVKQYVQLETTQKVPAHWFKLRVSNSNFAHQVMCIIEIV